MKKLELKHIVHYLPYNLKIYYNGKAWSIESVIMDNRVLLSNEDETASSFICVIKPILRPLSSMTKEEAYELGVLLMGEADMEDKEVGIGKMVLMGSIYPTLMYQDKEDEDYSVMIQFSSTGISGIDLIPYDAYEWLFNHHFDVFNLIDKGLAIAK